MYTVVGKIVDPKKSTSFDLNILGYKISDGFVVRDVNYRELKDLCKQRLVRNVQDCCDFTKSITLYNINNRIPEFHGSRCVNNSIAVVALVKKYKNDKSFNVIVTNLQGNLKTLSLAEVIKLSKGRTLYNAAVINGQLVSWSAERFFDGIVTYHINNGCLIKYNGTEQNIEIPSCVASIWHSAFSENPNLLTVKIPNSVTRIGNYVFSGCKSLISVEIPDSVKSIGACAFENCEKLRTVKIPDGVTWIGHSTFYGCDSLISVGLPDSVKEIGERAFKYSGHKKYRTSG